MIPNRQHLTIQSPLRREQRAKSKLQLKGGRSASRAAASRRAEVTAAAEGRAAELVEGRAECNILRCRAEEAKVAAAEGHELREEAEAGRAVTEGDALRLKTSQ